MFKKLSNYLKKEWDDMIAVFKEEYQGFKERERERETKRAKRIL